MKFKKPKFWDLKRPNLISYFLLPFTIFIILNNLFLSFKSRTKNEKIKSICVGNIYIGGTGKTPTTITIYEILKNLQLEVSTAKKFYESQSDEIQLLKNKTRFITSDNRKKILLKGIEENQKVIIFDDGLQDKSISYDLEFVCFDSDNFIGNGCLIPSGPLREKIDSLKKYDAIFIKGYNENIDDQLDIIRKYNKDIKIFETYFKIINLKDFDLNNEFLIFSGIGNPAGFKKFLINNKFKIAKEIIYADHYNFNREEIENIINIAKKNNYKIITTEKDFMKIKKFGLSDVEFLKVSLAIKNEDELINFLKNKIYA